MSASSAIASGFIASLVAGLGTSLGALPILARREWSARAQRWMLAAAGGIMLSATFFSLLQPALEQVREHGGSKLTAALTVAGGVALGALVLWVVHAAVPHQHFAKGREGGQRELGRHWLFVLAIALHNLPEGLSVGVAYAADQHSTGLAVALGIASQNLPEGLAVAAALVSDGMTRLRAFLIASLTGLIEPLGGLLGAFALSASEALLPWGLGFAGGAMLFVVSSEVLPETLGNGEEHGATFAVLAGFIAMMVLAVLLA